VILRSFFIVFCTAIFSSLTSGQGYDISIKINGLAEKRVILGHYLSKSMYPDDTVNLDSKGTGVFHGKTKLPEGMYVVFLPSSRYFDIVIGNDQVFSLEADTSDFLKSIRIKGSDENQVFLDFQKYMVALTNKSDSITHLIRSENDINIKNNLRNELRILYNARTERIEAIEKEHPQLFISVFLRSTLDVVVPYPPKDESGRVKDSTWQYYYYRNHYFDNFNYTDARLLRTPLYEDKIMNYMTKVIPQVPDSLIRQIDYFMEKSRTDSSVFRYMLITFFNYYAKSNIMGMDAVQVHLAEKYYLKDSWWSDEKFLAELKDRVDKTKPLLIGQIAPEVELMVVPADHFMNALADSALQRYPHVGTKVNLSQIKAKYLVLIFWEAECGHCKVAVPELYKIYEDTLRQLDVKVLAISTLFGEDGKIKWVNFVNEHRLYGWMNAWNPYSYDFKLKYDIMTTPQIFILDENKRILAKKISPEQVKEIILTFIK